VHGRDLGYPYTDNFSSAEIKKGFLVSLESPDDPDVFFVLAFKKHLYVEIVRTCPTLPYLIIHIDPTE
jgi:hypothetical protein